MTQHCISAASSPLTPPSCSNFLCLPLPRLRTLVITLGPSGKSRIISLFAGQLISSLNCHLSCDLTYSQVSGIRDGVSLGGCGGMGALPCLPHLLRPLSKESKNPSRFQKLEIRKIKKKRKVSEWMRENCGQNLSPVPGNKGRNWAPPPNSSPLAHSPYVIHSPRQRTLRLQLSNTTFLAAQRGKIKTCLPATRLPPPHLAGISQRPSPLTARSPWPSQPQRTAVARAVG